MRRPLNRAALALTLAVALTACVPGDDDLSTTPPSTGDAAAPASTQTAAPTTTADDTSAGEPATDGLFVRVQFDDTLSSDELAAVRALDGVAAVTADRRDDLALFRSRRSGGRLVDDLPDGFKISLAALVDDDEVGLGLAPGEAAMTATGLALRDIDVGGTLRLAGDRVVTVVRHLDAARFQDVEIVVAEQDADAMDVRARQRGIVRLAEGADPERVAAAVQGALGPDAIIHPRVLDQALVLSLAATKARFGEFAFRDLEGRDIQQGTSFIEQRVTQRDVPFFGRITCHEAMFDPLVAALQRIRDEGNGDQIDASLYGGCWTPRRINRNASLSRHAWGIAIDINVDFNAPGLGPIPSEEVITAFEDNGFRWGGDYPIPDNHHFEYVGG